MKIPYVDSHNENTFRLRNLVRPASSVCKIYSEKAVCYGRNVEILEYKKIQITLSRLGVYFPRSGRTERAESSISRARTGLFRLVEANVSETYKPVFLTLTFANHVTDISEAAIHYKNFIKRLNYHEKKEHTYVGVPEFTKIGRIHYHIVFFNLSYIDKYLIQSIWGRGFSRIETVKNIKSSAAYLCKYFSKAASDPRLFGRRAYYTSRRLNRPIHIYGKKEVDLIREHDTLTLIDERDYKEFVTKKYICHHSYSGISSKE